MNHDRHDSRGRRAFLQAVGLSAMALPLVSLPGQARAAAAYPKRLVIVTSSNGTSMPHFWPPDAGTAVSGSGITSSRILEPLTPLAAKLIVMRGLDAESAYTSPVPPDHAPDYANLLTGRQPVLLGTSYVTSGISIDQHIANVVGRTTKFPSIHLGGGARIHSRGFNRPVAAENSPNAAVQKLFGDLSVEGAKLLKQRTERQSVLGLISRRLKAARCRLGAADQLKIDAHVESVEDLLARTSIDLPSSCAAPLVNDAGYPEKIRSFMDLTVAALACDATRVATIDFDNGGVSHPFANYPGTNVPYHGGIAHDGSDEGFKKVAEIERWVATQFAYLISKMDSIVEGDGTLLDHSVVVWMKEQANGSTHSRRDYPVVMAGSASGAFKTGRAFSAGGKSHSGLLIAIANAMDVPTEKFGDPNFSAGPLSGL